MNTRRAHTHPQRLEVMLHIAAHSRTSHTFPHAGLGKTFTAYRRVWTNRGVQSAHTHGHWTLSLPNLCNRAAPPHNNLFINSKNVSAFHLQNTHGSRREGAIGFRHLKLETGPKNTLEEGKQCYKAPLVRGRFPGTVQRRNKEPLIHLSITHSLNGSSAE